MSFVVNLFWMALWFRCYVTPAMLGSSHLTIVQHAVLACSPSVRFPERDSKPPVTLTKLTSYKIDALILSDS